MSLDVSLFRHVRECPSIPVHLMYAVHRLIHVCILNPRRTAFSEFVHIMLVKFHMDLDKNL